jgi:hypothetical protein
MAALGFDSGCVLLYNIDANIVNWRAGLGDCVDSIAWAKNVLLWLLVAGVMMAAGSIGAVRARKGWAAGGEPAQSELVTAGEVVWVWAVPTATATPRNRMCDCILTLIPTPMPQPLESP